MPHSAASDPTIHPMKKKPSSPLLVALQFTAFALCVLPFAGSGGSQGVLVFCLAGAAVGLWTVLHNRPGNFGIYPELKEGARFITTGPYRWVRHPMYLSVLLLMFGIGIYNGQWPNYLGLILLWLALLGKMAREERYLTDAFPDYAAYARQTRRILPFVY